MYICYAQRLCKINYCIRYHTLGQIKIMMSKGFLVQFLYKLLFFFVGGTKP